MKNLFTYLLAMLSVTTYAQTEDWFTSAGTNAISGTTSTYAYSDFDPWGNIIMVGELIDTGSIQTTQLPKAIHLTKLNRHGQAIWVKSFVDTMTVNAIKVDVQGNIFICGSRDYKAYIAKLSSAGNLVWDLKAGGNNGSRIIALDFDESGNIYITGLYGQTLVLGTKSVYGGTCGSKPFIGKLSATGTATWLNTSDANSCPPSSKILYVKNTNRIIVTGTYKYFSYQNFTLPTQTLGFTMYAMVLDTNGVVKKVSGNLGSNSFDDSPGDIASDESGSIYLVGDSYGRMDFNGVTVPFTVGDIHYILKMDTGLNPIWFKYTEMSTQSMGDRAQLAIERNKVIMMASGGPIIFGTDTVTTVTTVRPYLVIFDTSGAFINSSLHRGDVMSLQCDNNGTLVVTGDISDSYPGLTWGIDIIPAMDQAYFSATIKVPQLKVSGNVFYDNNGNGTKDGADWGIANILVYDTITNTIVLTDHSGNYSMFLNTGTHTVKITPLDYTNTSRPLPNATYLLTDTPDIFYYNNRNFGIKPIPGVSDLWVDATPVSQFRPGFTAGIILTAGNRGTDTLNATVQYVVPSFFTVGAISVAPSFQSGDTLRWQLNSLKPFEQRTIGISVLTDLLTPFGTTQTTAATISPVLGDTLPANNTDSLKVTVTSSFDPNFKEVLPEGDITTEFLNDDSLLQYVVHFQNTGNDTAIFVVLLDTIDIAKLDIRSLQFISSSHPCTMRILDDKIIEFTFENIYLPDSNINEEASHGFAKFSIKAKQGLAVNTEIKNNAAIFFDYNEPVITNRTNTKIVSYSVGIEEIAPNLQVYPNPTQGSVTVEMDREELVSEVIITDILGRVSDKYNFHNADKLTFDITGTGGIYFVTINQQGRYSTFKVIKQ